MERLVCSLQPPEVVGFFPFHQFRLLKNQYPAHPQHTRLIKRASPALKTERIGLCLPSEKRTRFDQTKAIRLTLLSQKLTICSIRLSMALIVFVRTRKSNQFFQKQKLRWLYHEHLTRLRQQQWMGGSWRGWSSRTQQSQDSR